MVVWFISLSSTLFRLGEGLVGYLLENISIFHETTAFFPLLINDMKMIFRLRQDS
jgi:hypothetical protein